MTSKRSECKDAKGNLVAVVWHDKRGVRLLSTNSEPTDATIKRRTGQDVNDVPCPEVVINYTKFMGGVDLADQNRIYYDMGRDEKNFWKCLMWYMINTCVVNSYVIYKQTMLAAGKHPIRHLAFRQKLITQLIGGFSNRKRAGRRGAEAPVIEESQFPGHTLIKAAKRVCKNCSQLGNKTTGGGQVQTSFK